MPKVTVLLPVYNGEQFLRETIESIVSQSFRDFELLIIDDGSIDRSSEIIQAFQDDRIRVLKNEKRLKLSGALNRGLDAARGIYIARMDADDIALPNRLQEEVCFLDNHPDIGLCGSAIEVFGESVTTHIERYPAGTEQIRCYALFDCPFCHPSVMMRKTLLDRHHLRYDGSYYPTEDYELWSRAVMLFPTANLETVLLRYRVHGASMTGADWGDMDRQATRIIGHLFDRAGIACTAGQLQLHRNIGRGRSCRLSNIRELAEAEAWLRQLLTENTIYEKQALAATVALVWFRLCLNNTGLGPGVWRRYLASGLRTSDPLRIRHAATICASTVKQMLPGRRVG